MEEKKSKNVGLVIACICNVILVGVIIAGVIYYAKTIDKTTANTKTTPKTESETEVVENTVTKVQEAGETSNSSSTKIDDSKELVYIIKTDKRIEDIDEEEYIEYPQININTENIKVLNEKIKKYALKDPWKLETNYYINKGIISLVITKYTPGDNYYTHVFNIDSTNGNMLTNEELLYKMGITEDLDEKLNNAVQKVVAEHVPESGSGTEESTQWSDFNWASIAINEYDGLEIKMPLFINGNGKLSTVVEYTVPAGSGGPWGIIVEVE